MVNNNNLNLTKEKEVDAESSAKNSSHHLNQRRRYGF